MLRSPASPGIIDGVGTFVTNMHNDIGGARQVENHVVDRSAVTHDMPAHQPVINLNELLESLERLAAAVLPAR